MSISFRGIRDKATFTASNLTFGTDEGKVCKATANKTVGLCSDGDRFHGVIETIERDNAYCVVRKTGYVTLAYTGSDPSAGIVKFSADASGGVKVDNTNGIEYLVVDVDTTDKKVTLFLG
ncbi:MAG: hypothetical protein ACETWG_10605 [Candidatus Neomarinimicrobiota bacterium]